MVISNLVISVVPYFNYRVKFKEFQFYCFHKLQHDFVDWSRSHNARNFTAALEGDSACIWYVNITLLFEGAIKEFRVSKNFFFVDIELRKCTPSK